MHDSPRHPSRPALAARTAMMMAASGSAHHQPTVALSRRHDPDCGAVASSAGSRWYRIRCRRSPGRGAAVVRSGDSEETLDECNLHTIVRLPSGVFAPYTTIKTNVLFFTKGEPTKKIWYYKHPYPDGYKSYSKTKPMRIEEQEAAYRRTAPRGATLPHTPHSAPISQRKVSAARSAI